MELLKKAIQKYNNIPKAAKASIWYTFCNILQNGITFVTIPIYTRILTTSEYGNYVVFQSWRDIIIIFATLNLYCGVFTKAMIDYQDDRDSYTSSMQGLSTTITLLLFGVYYITRDFWNNIWGMETITIILLFGYYIFFPAFSFWTVRQRVEFRYVKMVVTTLIISVATPIISLFLLRITDLRENAVIWGYLIVQIIVGLFFYIYHVTQGKIFYKKDYWLYALKYNIPLIPHYLSLIILGQADRIMISDICGSEKAAIYSLAYQVSIIMNIFISAINNSFVPWIYEKLKVNKYDSIRLTSKYIGLLIVVMSMCAILVAPEIVKILGTEEYMSAIWIIPAVATSVYFTYCYGLFGDIEFYYGKTKYVMIASTVGAILNIILNAIFIPIFGFIAAGYTTLFCYLVFMIMHYYYSRKICEEQIHGIEVFDIKFIVISCIGLCVCSVICIFMYNFFVLRYFLILTATVFFVLFRKKIITILKSLKG